MHLLIDFWVSESGQDLTEYGLLAAFVSLAAVGALTAFGGTLAKYWQDKADVISRALNL